MNRISEKPGAWFIRIPSDILRDSFIMDNASATDLRVYLAIAQHQSFKNQRTFPLAIAKTAEEARCSRRAVIRSISWWCEIGALIKTKCRRMNVYEIPQHFTVSPRMSANPRHNKPRLLKRDVQGRIAPSVVTVKVPTHGTSEVPTHGTPNQRFSSEVFIKNPPPPPHGGNGRSSETSVRPVYNNLSEETIRDFVKIKGKDKTLEMLERGNYRVPAFLREVES